MLPVILAVLGALAWLGGIWLVWDEMNAAWHLWELGKKPQDFRFPLPFFLYTLTAENWTLAWDISIAMQVLALILITLAILLV